MMLVCVTMRKAKQNKQHSLANSGRGLIKIVHYFTSVQWKVGGENKPIPVAVI